MNKIAALIPDETTNEALEAIQYLTMRGKNQADLAVHLCNKFRIPVTAKKDGTFIIAAEKRKSISCTAENFLQMIVREIYSIDEAISEGTYVQSKKSMYIIDDLPPAPAHFDIPVFDRESGKWYDAEY